MNIDEFKQLVIKESTDRIERSAKVFEHELFETFCKLAKTEHFYQLFQHIGWSPETIHLLSIFETLHHYWVDDGEISLILYTFESQMLSKISSYQTNDKKHYNSYCFRYALFFGDKQDITDEYLKRHIERDNLKLEAWSAHHIYEKDFSILANILLCNNSEEENKRYKELCKEVPSFICKNQKEIEYFARQSLNRELILEYFLSE